MADPLRRLAKKKAMQETGTRIDYDDKPKYVIGLDNPDRVASYERAKDSEENLDDIKRAKPKMDEDGDHETKNLKVKQMRKFNMMKSMLGIMDEMD